MVSYKTGGGAGIIPLEERLTSMAETMQVARTMERSANT